MVATVLWGLGGAVSTADEVVRIMAANISSGSNQSYDGGEGSRIFDGLDPDIALVQEMNVGSNSAASYDTWVGTYFGAGFSYFVESGKNIPNGIVSRYPITASGVWDDPEIGDREFVWARIDLPGDKNLLAVSVHFKASSGSTNETRRNNQAVALNDYIAGEIEATDHVVIGGDFNTFSRNPSNEPCLGTLSSRVVIAAPWPADQAGNTNTNASQSSPYDWVMPGPSLAALATPLVIGPNTHANGLVFDSRDYTPLSAVAPVLSGDSGATGMQHMAVMRAFLIPTNDAPVITQGGSVAVTLSKNNTPTAFSRSLNATDGDGDPLTWSISTAAAHGTAGIVAPATGGAVALSYVPALNYVGTDSFVVQVADGQGGTDLITVNLTISPPPNSAPVITQGTSVAVTLSKNNTPTAFSRSLNATDVDGNPLSWSISTAATNGTAGIVAPATGGTVALSYVPALNYVGTDSFVVQVADGQGGTDLITVNLTISPPPNSAPVITQGGSVAVTLSKNNTPTAFSRSLNATDVDGNPLTWSVSTAAANGTAGVVAPATGGSVVLSYVPTLNYVGSDSFVVQVADGQGGTDLITVNLTISPPPNSAPVITQGTSVVVTLSKNNTPTAFSRSLNATDVDGNPLTWSISTAATNGTAGIVAPATGGTVALSYVPALNYVGTDSFVVQVADGQGGTDLITVNLTIEPPPNVVPEIAEGGAVAVTLSKDNTPVAFSRSLSASDTDNDPLAWSISTPAAHGTAGVVAPGTGGTVVLSYEPALGYVGPDSFVVQVSDGQGGTDTIAVNLTIEEPPNVSPEIADGSAVAVTLSKDNTPVAFSRSLSASDADNDPLAWSISTPAGHGTAGVVAPGTGGTVVLSYEPALGYVGPDSFVVQVSDGQGGTDTIAVNLTIEEPPNVSPEIADGSAVAVTLSKDNTPVAFSRSLSASDADNDPLAWTISTPAGHGTAGVVAPAMGGTVALSYVSALGYVGPDSFVVQVSDGEGGTDTITVNLTVEEPPNVSPEIAGPAEVMVTLSQDGYPSAFQQALAATDADADPLSWSVTVPAAHGSASVVAPASGGSVELAYQPDAGFTGVDAFTVQVSDGRGGSDTVVVQVTVEASPAYDSWTFDRFAPLALEDEGTRWGENADPDGDGFTNLEEFAHGLDPLLADAAPNLVSISREGSALVLSYKVRMDGAVAALDYSVMATVDPAAGWAVLPAEAYEAIGDTDLGGGFRLRSIRLLGGGPPARFFRLQFARHPEP